MIGIFLGIVCPCQCRRVAAAPLVQYPRVMCVATSSTGSSRGWSRGLSSARPLDGPPHSPRLCGHSLLSVLGPALLIDFCRPPRYTGSAGHYLFSYFFNLLFFNKKIIVKCHNKHVKCHMSYVTFHLSLTPTATYIPLLTPTLSTED